MNSCMFYCPGGSAATAHAVTLLEAAGCCFPPALQADTKALLLPVPLTAPDTLTTLLPQLQPGTHIFGGLLPSVDGQFVHDLVKDALYAAENAAITAHCTLRLIAERLPVTLQDCPILIIGWGRIGKCLAQLLRNVGANVTVAARKETDRAILCALGYNCCPTHGLQPEGFRVIVNTATAPVLPYVYPEQLAIDLASERMLSGSEVLHARGLPGKLAPESSGALIARSVLRILKSEGIL